MTINTRSNNQSANSELYSTNDEILIPVSTNIPIVLSSSSAVVLKISTKAHMTSTDMTYMQHQVDRLRHEIEKNVV